MSSRPRVVAIVPSAGFGKRLGMKAKKPFVRLGGRPLVTYALKALDKCPSVDAIVIACEGSCIRAFEGLVKKFKIGKVREIVVGGATRYESVKNCLDTVTDEFDIALIHDGARPFIDRQTIEESIRLADRFGGCVVSVPENDTVKLAGRGLFIKGTLDRANIFRAQTPQAFRLDLIKKAYAGHVPKGITDDSGLVERLGAKVKILQGSYKNIKITTKEDLKIAETLI